MDYTLIGIGIGIALAVVGILVYKHNAKTVAAVETKIATTEDAVKTVVSDVKKV